MRRRLLSIVVLGLVTLMYVKTLPGHSKADAFANVSFLYIAFFMTGVCARQYIEEIRRRRLALMGAVAIVIVAAFAFDQPRLGEWAVIAPLTLVAGASSTPVVRSASRFGDLSYGIYLYAYFLQQLTVRLWPGQPSFGASATVATLATVRGGVVLLARNRSALTASQASFAPVVSRRRGVMAPFHELSDGRPRAR